MSYSRNVPETEQEGFSFLRSVPEDQERPGKEHSQTPPNFLDPNPERIFVGEVPLGKYLEQNGFGWVVRLREWMFKSDWSPFVSAYTAMGSKAVHPGILMGLIVYGMLQKQWSLRDLEKLASNEPEMVRPMLEQHKQIFDALPSGLLLDGAYCTFGILGLAVDLDVDLLCPAGREDDADGAKGDPSEKSFPKRDFHYDEPTDSYLCPPGHRLRKRGGVQVRKGTKSQKFQCDLPAECPHRNLCTRSKQGRTIIVTRMSR